MEVTEGGAGAWAGISSAARKGSASSETAEVASA